MYWELSQKDFVFQKCSLVSVSETSFKEIKQRKKEENFTVVFPYFFNLNLNYEKNLMFFKSKDANYLNTLVTQTEFFVH